MRWRGVGNSPSSLFFFVVCKLPFSFEISVIFDTGEVFLVCGFRVVSPVAILATCALLSVLCGLLPHSRSKFLAEYAAMFSRHKKGILGFRDRSGPKRFWRMPLCLMAGTSGAPRPLCGPGGDVSLTSQLVCKKAIFAKNKGFCSRSSSSCGGEERKPSDQEDELKKLRAQVELLSKQLRVGKGPETQGEPTRRGSGLEEDCQIEVEAARKSWMSKRKAYRVSCETLRSLRTWIRFSGTGRKKSGRNSCKIWRGRRSNRRYRRGLRSCRVCRTRRGITSRTLALVKKKCTPSVKKCGKGRHFARQADLEDKIQTLQARRGGTEGSKLQPRRRGGEEKEDWEGDWDDEKAASGWYEGDLSFSAGETR